MKWAITLILVAALLFIPPVPAPAQTNGGGDPQWVLQCVVVVVIVAGGTVLYFKVIKPLCQRISSNRNWMLTNVVDNFALLSGTNGTGPFMLQHSVGLGNVWYEDTTFNIQENSGLISVVASRNGVPLMTNTVAPDTNGVATLDFRALPLTVTNPPTRFFRLLEN